MWSQCKTHPGATEVGSESLPKVATLGITLLCELRAAIDAARHPMLAGELDYLIAVAEERSWGL
jgi:hypothetical protein